MILAQQQRQALCDTALAVGPDAPTLCSPWTVKDLLAHLVIRERRPDTLPGIGVSAFAGHTDKVQDEFAARDFADLVDLVRQGPPKWAPTAIPAVDNAINTTEFVIHHEDIRRAQPDWSPAEMSSQTEQGVWDSLKRIAKISYRQAPTGVVLVSPGYGRMLAHRPSAGRASVVLTGAPVELILHAFGRTGVAQIDITGDEADVAALADSERKA